MAIRMSADRLPYRFRESERRKFQMQKFQIPKKSQIPNSNGNLGMIEAAIGIFPMEFFWILVSGIWNLPPPTLPLDFYAK
jgi:hypothetical protein